MSGNKEINDLTLNPSPAVTAEIETQVTSGGISQKTTLDDAVKAVLPEPGVIGGTTPADGNFSDLDASGALTGATIDGVLGSVTPAAISGTTVTTSGIVSVDDTTDTTSGTDGSIHTDGGVGIAKKLFVGTTSTLTGDVTGPSGTWDSGGMDIAAADTFAIAGTDVLDATTLGAAVVNSSLTSLGTVASLVATTADINAGTVDAVIGGTTPAAGAFTTVGATGLITATGGQIAFPATQVPSAGANVLDDYEEGTWTPALTFATPGDESIILGTAKGRYTKIGRQVICAMEVVTSTFTHTTAAGAINITGLPFTVANTSNDVTAIPAFQGITKANYTSVGVRTIINTTTAQLYISGSAQSLATVSTGDMPTGGTVILICTFVFNV